ncbi:MAG: hypothetical protein E6997_21400 [Citrobacter sp.]|jgi:3-hydroxymyristoyl/3-hydroxydecanoyl-(acyl carrier protein) dehydratase|uniref:hypothetical protein n=1 Tax=Bacillota TaxID=1239 RepID=UPI001F577608|nr:MULTISPECIES: hypothetical protein [Bacillota]MDU0937028.1 hypothetical protein [Dermabacter sp.]MDU1109604.1 hypothetical protein [Staphylococcus epidermidis]MDU1185535.1 hypothetical protein [Citrobacter sp.]MCI2768010.1 hypothetical protein [Staphylococcus warneri]MCI2787728.1 hypothetical protein [Staphylococcus warneri]
MINYEEIKEKLPQQYPFIMIRQANFNKNQQSLQSYMFLSDFQNINSIYPFSFIVEGAAQSCIILYKLLFPHSEKKQFLLTGINNTQINRQCMIGERLIYVCSFTRTFEKGAFSEIKLYSDTEYIGEINLSFFMN